MAYQVQPKLTSAGIAGVGRGFSPELWDGFDPASFLRNPALGNFYQDDFIACPTIINNTAVTASMPGNYNVYTGATAGSKIGGAGLQGGGMKLFNTTANELTAIQLGAVGSLPFFLANAPEDDTYPYHHVARVRFECRFSTQNVTAGVQGIFIGLAGVLAAGDIVDTTGELVASKPFVGFSGLGASANSTLRAVYEKGATLGVSIAALQTMVINTFYSVGFDFNPMAKPAERLSWWLNGEKQSTFVTAAQVASASTTFPVSTDAAQSPMSPTFMLKSISGADCELTIADFRICQELISAMGNEAIG